MSSVHLQLSLRFFQRGRSDLIVGRAGAQRNISHHLILGNPELPECEIPGCSLPVIFVVCWSLNAIGGLVFVAVIRST